MSAVAVDQVPHGTEDTFGGLLREGETPEEALRRLEKTKTYTKVIGSDDGQRLLAAATDQVETIPNGGVKPQVCRGGHPGWRDYICIACGKDVRGTTPGAFRDAGAGPGATATKARPVRVDQSPPPTTAEARPIAEPAAARLEQVPLDLIDVGANVRVDPGDLDDLVASIREHGVLQPVKAMPHPAYSPREGRYLLIWGQRRVLASRLVGLSTIPTIVVDHAHDWTPATGPDPKRSIEQLAENLVRKDLNPIEEAVALRAVLNADTGLTQEALADKLGRSRPWVSNALRLLTTAPEVQAKVRSGELSASHAKAIAALPEKQQRELATRITRDGISSRDIENEIKWKADAALQDVNKAAKTERSIPRLIAALEKAAVTKDTPLFVHGPSDVDVDTIVRAVKKAGWTSATNKYVYGGRPEVCACTALRVEIGGRSPSLQPTCTNKSHQALGRDAAEKQRRAAEDERQRLTAELRDVVWTDLDIARPRHSILALLSWSLANWHTEGWDAHAARDDDQHLDAIAKAITEFHRVRDVDLTALIATIRATQGPGNAGAGPGRTKSAKSTQAAAAAAS